MAVTVEPFDLATLARRAPLVWSSLDVTLNFNDVGAFTLELPATDTNRNLLGFDGDGLVEPIGLIVDWNGVATIALLVEEANPARKADDSTVTETIILAGADLLALLANRIAYPNPTAAWSAQIVSSVTKTGKPETVIKDLITANMVTAGDTVRRVPHLAVATDEARGGTCTWHITTPDPANDATTDAATVNTNLLAIWRSIAAQSATPIGLRIDLTGGQIVADCYEPRDLSAHAVFSPDLGNLTDASLTVQNPSANAVLLQSNVAAGKFTQSLGKAGTDPWRRVESFSDQSSATEAADVTQAAADAVASGAAQTTLSATAVDTPRLRVGADDPVAGITGYWLGDLVAVDLWAGLTYSDIVASVHLVAQTDGDAYTETATPTIGSTTDDNTISAALQKQLTAIEQRLKGA